MVDGADSIGATDVVRTVLTSSSVQSINFTCRGVSINRFFFKKVIDNLSWGLGKYITVFIDSGVADPEAFASYDPVDDALTLRSYTPGNLSNRASIVHECVHAGLDKIYCRLPFYDQEVLAYLGAAFYVLAEQATTPGAQGALYPPKAWDPPKQRQADPAEVGAGSTPRIQAWITAASTQPSGTVTWEQYLPLKAAVLSRPIYKRLYDNVYGEKTYRNNG